MWKLPGLGSLLKGGNAKKRREEEENGRVLLHGDYALPSLDSIGSLQDKSTDLPANLRTRAMEKHRSHARDTAPEEPMDVAARFEAGIGRLLGVSGLLSRATSRDSLGARPECTGLRVHHSASELGKTNDPSGSALSGGPSPSPSPIPLCGAKLPSSNGSKPGLSLPQVRTSTPSSALAARQAGQQSQENSLDLPRMLLDSGGANCGWAPDSVELVAPNLGSSCVLQNPHSTKSRGCPDTLNPVSPIMGTLGPTSTFRQASVDTSAGTELAPPASFANLKKARGLSSLCQELRASSLSTIHDEGSPYSACLDGGSTRSTMSSFMDGGSSLTGASSCSELPSEYNLSKSGLPCYPSSASLRSLYHEGDLEAKDLDSFFPGSYPASELNSPELTRASGSSDLQGCTVWNSLHISEPPSKQQISSAQQRQLQRQRRQRLAQPKTAILHDRSQLVQRQGMIKAQRQQQGQALQECTGQGAVHVGLQQPLANPQQYAQLRAQQGVAGKPAPQPRSPKQPQTAATKQGQVDASSGSQQWSPKPDSSGASKKEPSSVVGCSITRLHYMGAEERQRAFGANADLDAEGSEVHPSSELTIFEDVALGKGALSTIFAGRYQGRPVAVKVLSVTCVSGPHFASEMELIKQEVSVLSTLQHPNLVQLIGACLAPPHVFLVQEQLSTDLSSLLHPQPAAPDAPVPEVQMSVKQALRIALDIAKGLEHLHTRTPLIIHRDLKTENILLDKHWRAKVSEGGLSRCKYQASLEKARREAGTLIYYAPECFNPELGKLTEKADIYSLGVVFWELVTHKKPWEGSDGIDFLRSVMVDGARLPLPYADDVCPAALRCLISCCWSADPSERPSASEAVGILTRLFEYWPEQ